MTIPNPALKVTCLNNGYLIEVVDFLKRETQHVVFSTAKEARAYLKAWDCFRCIDIDNRFTKEILDGTGQGIEEGAGDARSGICTEGQG